MENVIKNPRLILSKNNNTLEEILDNPVLQHLADNLNFEYLEVCQGINQSSKQILDYQMDKPMFMLRKCRRLSKKNQKDWIKVIESAKNSEKENSISSYLQRNLKKEALVDLPCYLIQLFKMTLRAEFWKSVMTGRLPITGVWKLSKHWPYWQTIKCSR